MNRSTEMEEVSAPTTVTTSSGVTLTVTDDTTLAELVAMVNGQNEEHDTADNDQSSSDSGSDDSFSTSVEADCDMEDPPSNQDRADDEACLEILVWSFDSVL